MTEKKEVDGRFDDSIPKQKAKVISRTLSMSLRKFPPLAVVKKKDEIEKKKIDLLFEMSKEFLKNGLIVY
jgi:hypothetical protein